jgi:hypothetical protein
MCGFRSAACRPDGTQQRTAARHQARQRERRQAWHSKPWNRERFAERLRSPRMSGLLTAGQSVEIADRELAPRQRAALVVVDRLELFRQRGIVLPVGQERAARAPHAHEIDLGLGDPAGRLVKLQFGLRTGDRAREALDLGRERRIAQHRHA